MKNIIIVAKTIGVFMLASIAPTLLGVYTLSGGLESDILGYQMGDLNYILLGVGLIVAGYFGIGITWEYAKSERRQ